MNTADLDRIVQQQMENERELRSRYPQMGNQFFEARLSGIAAMQVAIRVQLLQESKHVHHN